MAASTDDYEFLLFGHILAVFPEHAVLNMIIE